MADLPCSSGASANLVSYRKIGCDLEPEVVIDFSEPRPSTSASSGEGNPNVPSAVHPVANGNATTVGVETSESSANTAESKGWISWLISIIKIWHRESSPEKFHLVIQYSEEAYLLWRELPYHHGTYEALPRKTKWNGNAVVIHNAVMEYKPGERILDHLNLKIRQGSIYVICGHSGSGKTTLIKACAGLRALTSGTISILGSEPATRLHPKLPRSWIGVMPQSYSLYKGYTAYECLHCFGKFYGMETDDVNERIQELARVVEITDLSKLISKYSGGQQRRISFMVALIHRPKFVVLDEPTVGLDSILRRQIWDYLVRCTQDTGMAVFISTHYINEARRANMMGVLRNGKIVLQGSYKELQIKLQAEQLSDGIEKFFSQETTPGIINEAYVPCEEETKVKVITKEDLEKAHQEKPRQQSCVKMESHVVQVHADSNGSVCTAHSSNASSSNTDVNGNQNSAQVATKEWPLNREIAASLGLQMHFLIDGADEVASTPECIPQSDDDEIVEVKNDPENHENGDVLNPVKLETNRSNDINNNRGHAKLKIRKNRKRKDDDPEDVSDLESDPPQPKVKIPSSHLFDRSSLSRMRALTAKNIFRIIRSTVFLVFNMLIPSFEITTLFLSLGNGPVVVHAGLYNLELAAHNLTECPYMPEDRCDVELLSCKILQQFPNRTFNFHYMNSEEELLAAANATEIQVYFRFARNFSDRIEDWYLLGGDLDETSLNETFVHVGMDEMDHAYSTYIYQTMIEASEKFVHKHMNACNINYKQYMHPFTNRTSLLGNDDFTFRDFSTTSLLLAVLLFLPMISSCIWMLEEKADGTFDRATSAGVTLTEYYLAQTISEAVAMFLQTTTTLIVLRWLFGRSIEGNIGLVYLVCLLVAISGLSLGYLINILCNDIISAIYTAVGIFFPMLSISGSVWPLASLPPYVYWVGVSSPLALPSEALRSIVNRGWGLTNPNVWPGIVAPIVWCFIFFMMSLFFHRRAQH